MGGRRRRGPRPAVEPVHLALWHGLNLPLALSAVALAGGAALFAARRRLAPVLAAGGRLAQRVGGRRGAAGRERRGRPGHRGRAERLLPAYAGVILTTAALLLHGAAGGRGGWPGWPALVGSSGTWPCAALLATAVAAATVHRRFSAALLVGATGYAMAGLFVVQGGADLALTQVAIETLSTVLFVLVLRRLDRFETAPAGAACGAGDRRGGGGRDRVRPGHHGLGEPAGGADLGRDGGTVGPRRRRPQRRERDPGRLRGFDTLGEITVLSAAAIGVVALARAGRRPSATGQGPDRSLRVRHLVVVDVAVRLVVPAVLVGSLYLLFAGTTSPAAGSGRDRGGGRGGAALRGRWHRDPQPVPRPPWTVLGAGLAVAAAMVPLAFGGAVLESAALEADLPLLGHLKVTSALA